MPSMRIAMKDLQLSRMHVVHAGKDRFPLADGLTAIAAQRL